MNDDTNEVIMRKVGCEAIQCHGFDTGKTYDGSSGTDSPYIRHVNTKPNSKGITHRCHVREYATPLYGVNRLSLALMTLQDLVKGKTHLPAQSSDSAHFFLVLDIFHRAGWVHRDISMGNDFLLQKHELFKLGDLEFAKKIGKGGAHDVRTVSRPFVLPSQTKGTLDFMSAEVEKQAYKYLPVPSEVRFFYHHSLHELESVWCPATWILFFHYPVGTASLNAQKAAISELCPRILPSQRSLFIRTSRKFKTIVESLQVDFRPYGKKLDDLRASLQKAYSKFEAYLVDEYSTEYINDFH